MDAGNCQVGEGATVLILRPIEPKGANARLQSLIEPLGGTGTISEWTAPKNSVNAALNVLSTELSKAPSLNGRSVASFRNTLKAQVVVL